VAVKALVPSARREWLKEDFIRRANVVRDIKNATAIGITNVIDKGGTQCVVMEFVDAPTLAQRLKDEGRLSCDLVARVLKHIARVAMQLHKMEGQLVIGPIRPSQVHYDKVHNKVRISLVHIANETLTSCRQRPTLLLDDDALTYLSPERYDGEKVTGLTDQYYLGLLGLELLLGRPPVDVGTFANLEIKKQFFESPRLFFGELPSKQPAFSFVLARMLERKPEKRWASMSDLIRALQQIEAGEVPEILRERADEDYSDKLRDNRSFFHSFYQRFFESSDEIGKLFDRRGVKLDDQYRKLDRAMGSLLNFNRRLKTTSIDAQIESHGDFGLEAKHFEFFREAFLHALRQMKTIDEYSQEAWRAILDPALSYMRDKTCRERV
jgi:serine/threonine protein kinase